MGQIIHFRDPKHIAGMPTAESAPYIATDGPLGTGLLICSTDSIYIRMLGIYM
jgi:hypothetical protein